MVTWPDFDDNDWRTYSGCATIHCLGVFQSMNRGSGGHGTRSEMRKVYAEWRWMNLRASSLEINGRKGHQHAGNRSVMVLVGRKEGIMNRCFMI